MNISSIVTTKVGRAVIGAAAVGAIAFASLGLAGFAGVADAKSKRCDANGTCKTYCTQSLPNGNFIEYEEGTKIIVTNADGTETHYTCKNGDWVKDARIVVDTSKLSLRAPMSSNLSTR